MESVHISSPFNFAAAVPSNVHLTVNGANTTGKVTPAKLGLASDFHILAFSRPGCDSRQSVINIFFYCYGVLLFAHQLLAVRASGVRTAGTMVSCIEKRHYQ